MKNIRRTVLSVLLPPALCFFFFYHGALAGETGVDLIYNRVDRFANEGLPGSVDSGVLRSREILFWQPTLDKGDKLRVILEHEDYSLTGPTGDALIELGLTKAQPRLRMRRERWAADLGLLAVSLDRGAALYAPAPADNSDFFLFPALIGEMIHAPLSIRLGLWREYEVLPLDHKIYWLLVIQNLEFSPQVNFTEDLSGRASVVFTKRVYPSGAELSSTNFGLEFRLLDPLSGKKTNAAFWRELNWNLYQKHYQSGDKYRKTELQAVFKLARKSTTHFLKPRLTLTDSIVVYDRGTQPDSLVETTLDKTDLSLQMEYEGFTPLGNSPYFLAWGGTWEDSLLEGIQRTRIVHVKIIRTY